MKNRKLIHEALIELGFEPNKDNDRYKKDNLSIKVYPSDSLSDVFKSLMKFSETQKIWEIKRALQITDPYI